MERREGIQELQEGGRIVTKDYIVKCHCQVGGQVIHQEEMINKKILNLGQ